MLLRVFRGTGPGIVILILLTALCVWGSALFNPKVPADFIYDTNPMPLYLLLKSLTGKYAFGGVIFSLILVLLIAFLLVNFNTTVFFINERTFLPAVVYVLFTGMFPHYQLMNPVLPAAALLMIALMRIMEAYRKNGTAFNFFDASVFISTGALFYANLIWFSILVIVGIAILRTGNVRELFLALLGLITPLAITVGIYYVTGKDLAVLGSTVLQNLFGETGTYYLSRVTITGLVLISLVSLLSFVYLMGEVKSKKIKSRKTFTELIWVLLTSTAVYFSLSSVSVEIVFLVSIPLSYILSHYFLFSKNRILPDLSFTVIFIIIALVQVIYLM